MPASDLTCAAGAVAVYLSLGSNLGDRLANLREAVYQLEQHSQIHLCAISSLYETDPVGLLDQPLFYNVVIGIETSLPAEALLRICQDIENRMHRRRNVRWGPRTIDIDILTYNNLVLNSDELTLPHPEMNHRDFVKLPLLELKDGKRRSVKHVRPIKHRWYPD